MRLKYDIAVNIVNFLEASMDRSFSHRQIARAVDRNLYRDDAGWARPYLDVLEDQGHVERTLDGLYRFLPPNQDDTVSRILGIGKQNKKSFSTGGRGRIGGGNGRRARFVARPGSRVILI